MKKFFALLLGIIMIFSCAMGLTACSNDSPANNPPDSWSLDLTGYVANVSNATALGIMKLDETDPKQIKDNGVSLMRTKLYNKDVEEKNYIVKTNSQYNANNPELSESGIEKISFTKTITENVTTITTGTKYILAKENTNKQSCSITFASVKDFTYSIYLNDSCLLDNVVDNDNNDVNKEFGVVEIDGLEKDKEYAVKYSGVGEETTITQDEIEGEIDKLYVLNEYTFISFVPKGESKRPENGVLTHDTDGIATYDKCDYFSNGIDRQSFIIDNATGYVYDLKGFNIKAIQGGCLLSANDNYIYDFKINANNEVEIFSLFANDSIEWDYCFKDKYGNKFIRNNVLDIYDDVSKTYFYKNGNVKYELTSTGEAIKLERANTYWYCYKQASIILENKQTRSLNRNDNFEIFYSNTSQAAYKVVNGYLYSYEKDSNDTGYDTGLILVQFDTVEQLNYIKVWGTSYTVGYNTKELEKHNMVLCFTDEHALYYVKDVWNDFRRDASIINNNGECLVNKDNGTILNHYSSKKILDYFDKFDEAEESFLVYGINGNTYYEVVVEEVDGEIVVNKYIKGTYIKPQIKVVLQPLNK